jgi:XRE family aerobic/anaerobic benzoate catabolism transcriptional regulator
MALEKDFSWSEVGARIRDLRKQLDMSQQALATAAGITQNGVFRLEAGKTNPQLTTLQHIAAALGCSVRYLVSGTPERDPSFADRYQRIVRIVESRDDMAIRTMDGGIESAEELLERGGSRRRVRRFPQRTGPLRPGTHVLFEELERHSGKDNETDND